MIRRRAMAATVVAFALSVFADVAAGETDPFPGYPAVIGLFGCIGIIVISKWLGKTFLQRSERYYPHDVPADEQEDLRG